MKKFYIVIKNILAAGSTHFSELFEKDDSVKEVTLNEDPDLFKAYLKFLYTGTFDIAKEDKIIPFILTANKYKTKNIKEFKIPGKVVLKGILAYVEGDMKNRVGEFESLIQSVNFKKIDKDELKKYGKKSQDKWLTKNTAWLNVIVSKNSDESEDTKDSDESSKSGSDSESKSSESESKRIRIIRG